MLVAFFSERQAGAVLKHGLLSRYLHVFASKTGKTAVDNRVVFVDGYAGPGTYDDGSPGSPTLAVQTAEALAKHRTLEGIYVEKKAESVEKLKELLSASGHRHHVLKGAVADRIDDILRIAGPNAPMFVFLDPFGLGIAMDDIKRILARADVRDDGRRYGPATEVFLNFSFPGLRRTAGQLDSTGSDPGYLRARDTLLGRIDTIFGGDWWREIWRSEAADREDRILEGYLEQLAEIPAVRGRYQVPVQQRLNGPQVYVLVFLTQYAKEGLWEFNNSLSLALEDFHAFCKGDQLELEAVDDREERMVAHIKDNIAAILDSDGAFKVHTRMKDVLGDMLGHARDKHLRRAIKQLHSAGKTSTNGKGNVPNMVVKPIGNREGQ